MPFKKGTSGNPIGRPNGSVSTLSQKIIKIISIIRVCMALHNQRPRLVFRI